MIAVAEQGQGKLQLSTLVTMAFILSVVFILSILRSGDIRRRPIVVLIAPAVTVVILGVTIYRAFETGEGGR